jgi:hypothetical protein
MGRLMYAAWRAWEWDIITAGWVAWIVYFAVWETISLRLNGDVHPLTAHLRPVFLSAPVIWWIFLGLWLWLGIHMLAPAWEAALLRVVRG